PHRKTGSRRRPISLRWRFRRLLRCEELEPRTLLSSSPLPALLAAPTGEGTVTIQGSVTPDDSYMGSLWGMQKISAPNAWGTQKGSSKVLAPDIDTGIDYTHPDLYLNVYLNPKEIPAGVTVADADGGGVIPLRDLNLPANAGLVADSNGNGYIDAKDVLK